MDNIIEMRIQKSPGQLAEMGAEERLRKHVDEFNKRHSVVMIGGKTRIMRISSAESDVVNCREGYEFLSPEELKKAYKSTSIQAGLKIDKYGVEYPYFLDEFSAWFSHPDSNVYRSGVVFMPEKQAPDGYFNTWKGFGIAPDKKTNYKRIKNHIEHILCGGNEEQIRYFYSWVAYGFQNPEKSPRSAIVQIGRAHV